MSATLRAAREVLRGTFGYDEFRGHQAEIVEHVVAGGDALVLMPTGGGKSLCYQIPALLRDGVAVVVSPLIALMKDQVDALRQLGVRAAYLNSSLDAGEARQVETALEQGTLDLVYVAPERLLTPRFLGLLERCRVALFAIDEAHCVSQWGHDFRPEYLGLSLLAERYPGVPRIALTATADEVTRREMAEKLGLHQAARFVDSFDRPNIRYLVVEKRNAKQQVLDFYLREHQGEAGIIYCLSRRSVDETAAWLEARGVPALAYHAGLDGSTRQQRQEAFLQRDGLVMVATIAFGMGIDKPDVRFVAHLDLPKSLEGYYQETGRAGRDGDPATAFMTYGLGDVVTMRRMLASGFAPEEHKRVESQKLDALLGYCETAVCRRQVLLAYFGEKLDEPCGNCDTCLHPVDTFDGTVAAQKLLSTAVRTGQRFGAGHLIDVLLGRDTPRMKGLGHDRLSTFGIGKELDSAGWRSVTRQLVAAGYLTTDGGGHGSLLLTPKSAGVLRGEESVRLRRDAESTRSARPARRRAAEELEGEALARFEALRELRSGLAREQGVPPYVIFHDATLREMAALAPRSLARLGAISGVGGRKLERYGRAFLKALHGEGAELDDDLPPARTGANDEGMDTVEQTRALVLEGYSLEAVAGMRNLKLRTIEGHVAELVRRGELTVEEATGLGREALHEIETAVERLPEELRPRLKPLYEALGGRYSYLQLKCARAVLDA